MRGIDAVVAHREAPSGFYHVGDNETITWAKYYGALAAGLGVDPETIRAVPSDRYRTGLRDRVDELKALPIYKRARAWLPVEARAQIKRRLARVRGRERPMSSAADNAVGTREIWHLQTTRYRLPTTKFRATFGDHNMVPFPVGMAASLAWLRFIGIGLDEAA